MRKFIILVVALLFASDALAENGAGVDKYFNISPLKIGSAKFFYKGLIHVYDAALFSPNGKFDWNKPYALELTYKTEIDGKDIAEKSLEEMQKVSDFDQAKGQKWLQQMTAIFPKVDDGVSLTGISMPGKGVVFLKNGSKIGEIDDPEFAKAFFSIWLSERTSRPDLRESSWG